MNYFQIFGPGRGYYAVSEELRKARAQVACLLEFGITAANKDESFSTLNLNVFGGQKIKSPTKSHTGNFFRGWASSSSHLGEQETQALHSSHPWALVIWCLASMHQHFEFPWCYTARHVLSAGQDCAWCTVWHEKLSVQFHLMVLVDNSVILSSLVAAWFSSQVEWRWQNLPLCQISSWYFILSLFFGFHVK